MRLKGALWGTLGALALVVGVIAVPAAFAASPPESYSPIVSPAGHIHQGHIADNVALALNDLPDFNFVNKSYDDQVGIGAKNAIGEPGFYAMTAMVLDDGMSDNVGHIDFGDTAMAVNDNFGGAMLDPTDPGRLGHVDSGCHGSLVSNVGAGHKPPLAFLT